MSLAIETFEISKRYGRVQAVERLSLRVEQGEIYAFLGLNGAGKTTTIRMLLGMIRPTSGAATVLNTRILPGRREPWSAVGYLVETPYAYPELTVAENLEVARRLHPGTPPQAVPEMVERLRLGEYAHRRAGTLSLGNAQRLGLAKALLHRPRLVLLDEPANGLDPAGIVEVRALLIELTREQGVTVFMSSHILAEVARLADRVGIIHQGRLLQEMDIAELERNRRRGLRIQARRPEAASTVLADAGWRAEMLPGGWLEVKDPVLIEQSDEVAARMAQAGCPPMQLIVEEEELEQYFLRLVGLDGNGNHG